MYKTLGIAFGILFLLGGILGFVPGVTKDGMFLGVFMVNPPHSLVHLASGVIFLVASLIGAGAVRWWFQISGLVYVTASVIGFKVGVGMICGVISNNQNDSWGHAALALILLLIGFALPKPTAAA